MYAIRSYYVPGHREGDLIVGLPKSFSKFMWMSEKLQEMVAELNKFGVYRQQKLWELGKIR